MIGNIRKKEIKVQFQTLTQHLSEGTEENYVKRRPEARSLGRDLIPIPPEYELKMLLSLPRWFDVEW
jgi:hypothetical protein